MNYLSNLKVTRALSLPTLEELNSNLEQLGRHYDLEQPTIAVYNKGLLERHQEPQRHYHNLSHLYNLFHLLETFKEHIQQPALLQLAIWYHDSIYDPARKDNEFLSAQLAKKEWQPHLPLAQQEQLYAYIIATQKHQPQTQEQDELLFLDFDLSILAATPTVYKAYQQAIEKEYTTVYPLDVYRVGRQKALNTFLERPQIYYSGLFLDCYEATARANIAAELAEL